MTDYSKIGALQFELAMAIGSSLDLEAMLRTVGRVLLRALDASAVAVYREVERGRYVRVFKLPRVSELPESFEGGLAEAFLGQPPRFGERQSRYDRLAVPGFGALVIERAGPELEERLLRALDPLLYRLSHAARACAAHADLQRSYERFDTLIRGFPDVLFEGRLGVDGSLTFDFLSPAAALVLGLDGPHARELPSSVLALEVKDGSGSLAVAIARSAAYGEALDVVLRPQVGDPGGRWLRIAASRREGPEGEEGARWSGSIQDVSEHERFAEVELQQTRSRLSALLSAAADAIVVADAGGRVVDWNRGAETLLGYRYDEIVGEPLTRIMPARLRAAHEKGMERHRRTGESRVIGRPVELAALHSSGQEVPIELVINRLSRAEGDLYVAVLRDLSERRRADAARREELAHERRLASVLVELARLPSSDLMAFKTQAMAAVATALSLDRVILSRLVDGRWREVILDARTGQCSSLERTHGGALDVYLASLRETVRIVTMTPSPAAAAIVVENLEPAGVASMLAVPLKLADTHHGALCLASVQARDWSAAEVRFCEDAARVFVQAIDNAEKRHIEALNAAILASIREGVIACDIEGCVTLMNPVAERLTGWTTLEARGRLFEEVFAVDMGHLPGGGQEIIDSWGWDPGWPAGLVASRTILRRRDAEPIPVAFAASPIYAQATRLGTVITFRDVTEEEASSRALESRNEQLRSLSEALPDLLFTVGLDGHLEYRGGGRDAKLIAEAADLTDRSVGDVFSRRAAGELLEAVARAIQSDEVQTIEYEVPVGSGTRQHFEVRIARLTETTTTALVREVTLERANARALRLERERLKSVLATASAIIYSVSLPEYRMEYVSESAESVLGFTPDTLMEPGFWARCLHPLDKERVFGGLLGLTERGWHIHEYRHRHRDGSYRWLRDEVRVIYGERGEAIRAVGASFDISDRKLNELRLSSLLVIQEIVATASSAFLSSSTAPDIPLDLALDRLGRHLRCDRAYVFAVEPDGFVSNTHEWCAPGVEAFKEQLQHLSPETFAFFIEPISNGSALVIPSVSALPDSAAETREILAMQGIESLVAVPLLHHGILLGFLGVDNPQIEPLDLTELAPLMRLLADTLAAGHERRAAELSLMEANAGLAASNSRQKALVYISMELAHTTNSEDIYRALGPRVLATLGLDRAAVAELASDGDSMRIIPLDAALEAGRPREVERDGHETVVPIDALRGTAIMLAATSRRAVSTLEHGVEALSDWAHHHRTAGFTSFLVVPIVTPEGVLGTLEVAGRRPGAIDEDAIAWCTQLALLIGAHVGAQRARAELQRVNASLERTVLERTRELRASEERFALLFEKAPQAMLLVDRDHEVVQANASARSVFGIDELPRGLPVRELVPASFELHGRLMQRFIEEGDSERRMLAERHIQARRLDQSVFDAEITLQPIELGGVTHIVAGLTDITRRLSAERAIVASLREKETLLKEIHHRVKNNLQMISGLLSLQSAKVSSEETRRLLDESVGRVRSMALIHQQIYGVDSLDRVDFGNYVKALCESVRALIAPETRVRVEAEPVMLTVQNALPLGLILNELMTNAFKYGVAGEGEAEHVVVTLAERDGKVALEVCDRGPGLPADFDPVRTSSLGMRLVRMLVSQLRGDLRWSSRDGARFFVELDATGPGIVEAGG